MTIKEVIKKDGSKIYRQSVYLGVDSVTGKKVKTTVTGRTKKEVKQKAKQAEADFIKKGSTRSKMVDVKNYQELVDLWLETYQYTVRPQTLAVTKKIIKNHILPTFGSMKLHKVTTPFIQSFMNKLAPTFVNFRIVHSINRRILQYAVVLQLIPFNPAREIIIPKNGKKPRPKVKFIANDDLKELLNHIEKLSNLKYKYFFDLVLFKLLLATGCRIGEITALEWSDIDLEEKTISINKNYSQEINKIGKPKSQAGIRVISIDQKTINLLRLYQVRQQQLFLDVGADTPSVVFSTPTRKYLNRINQQERLDGYCDDLGIARFTFHAFRHTHASLLLNAGINYKELQHRLGHANITMTLDVYSHLSKAKEKEAVIYYEKAINSL